MIPCPVTRLALFASGNVFHELAGIACDAAKVITVRGFNRERDLVVGIKNAWDVFRPQNTD